MWCTHYIQLPVINCGQSFDIESFAIKVYKCIHISTANVAELKEFCAFFDVDYIKLLE
jgi:hypothetical protein